MDSPVVETRKVVPDEYTADDIQAALKEGEEDSDGAAKAAGDRNEESTPKQPLYGKGLGRSGRRYVPLPSGDVVALSDRPAHNGVWGGGDELPEWFAVRYKSEKYEHRLMAFMKAQGMSNVEISAKTGYCYGAVCQIMHLPWVVAVITEEIARSGRNAVQDLLQSSAMDCVQFLIKVRDDDKAQMRDRITADKELLDRIFGKPNQPITHREEVDLDSLTDKELAQIIGSNSNQPN